MWKFIFDRVRQNVMALTALGVLFFAIAGKVTILGFWIYVVTVLAHQIVSLVIIVPKYPEYIELANVRKIKRTDAKPWDKVVIFAVMMTNFLMYGLAAWDVGRIQISILPWWSVILGVILYIAGSVMNQWAMIHNMHFEKEVRIQVDRMHQVVESGPYQYIRHPGYLGSMFGFISFSLILGSGLAVIGSILCLAGIMVRTYLEDKTLRQELAGYEEYAKKVRSRLIPYVW